MKPLKKISHVVFLVCILPFLYSCNKTQSVYLSDIKQGFIANEFGPPGKDRSFEKNKLSIRDITYEKGLGVHAPSKISIDINGQGEKFYASVGLDDEVRKTRSDSSRQSLTKTADYVYDGNLDLSDLKQGGTVRFHISGDGKILLSTGWLSENSPAQEIDLNISGIKKLSLEVEKSPDGSFADHADWADARITMKNNNVAKELELYGTSSDILLNQTGFLPVSFKTFRTSESGTQKEFSIIDMATNKAIFTGSVSEKNGDWGKVFIGDFSAVQKPGKYYVQFGNKTSEPVSVSSLQYVYNLEKHLNWFLSQRCGDPEHGFERGQHRDDGVRLDNRKHQDVSGGWHDAADLRKWGMTINGLWALSETYLSLSSDKVPDFGGKKELLTRIKDEFNWGNKYYSAMQEPQGYLMDQIGGDVYKHGDNNRFTDNIPGTADDRWIVTTPKKQLWNCSSGFVPEKSRG